MARTTAVVSRRGYSGGVARTVASRDRGGSVPAPYTLWHLRLRNQFTSKGCRQTVPQVQVAWQKEDSESGWLPPSIR